MIEENDNYKITFYEKKIEILLNIKLNTTFR